MAMIQTRNHALSRAPAAAAGIFASVVLWGQNPPALGADTIPPPPTFRSSGTPPSGSSTWRGDSGSAQSRSDNNSDQDRNRNRSPERQQAIQKTDESTCIRPQPAPGLIYLARPIPAIMAAG